MPPPPHPLRYEREGGEVARRVEISPELNQNAGGINSALLVWEEQPQRLSVFVFHYYVHF